MHHPFSCTIIQMLIKYIYKISLIIILNCFNFLMIILINNLISMLIFYFKFHDQNYYYFNFSLNECLNSSRSNSIHVSILMQKNKKRKLHSIDNINTKKHITYIFSCPYWWVVISYIGVE
jgi:hypothetical protein